jgi:hypothetical protein
MVATGGARDTPGSMLKNPHAPGTGARIYSNHFGSTASLQRPPIFLKKFNPNVEACFFEARPEDR